MKQQDNKKAPKPAENRGTGEGHISQPESPDTQLLQEIQERKRIEQALRESEENYRLLIENMSEMVMKLDRDGNLLYVSPSCCEMFGKTEQELSGSRFTPPIHPNDKETVILARKYIFYPPHFVYYEYRTLTQYGWRWLASNDRAILDDNKTVVEVISVSRDITFQKEAQKESEDNETKYQALFNSDKNAILIQKLLPGHQPGLLTEINDAACKLTGYTSEELFKMKPSDFLIMPDNSPLPTTETMKQIDSQKEGVFERILVTKSGRHIPVEVNTTFFIFDGQPNIISIMRDVSSRKQLEAEQEKSSRLESLATLSGGIAHDFNNLLTGIIGNISLAQRAVEPDSKAAHRLDEAEKASLRARDLTQQLLTFARGNYTNKKIISLEECIRESVIFSLHGSNSRSIEDLPADLWPVEVDAGQINQAISNIVINASEAMPDGGTITIHAENMVLNSMTQLPVSAGHYVRIRISDKGTGIPIKLQDRIFEPYFSTKQRGSGLGLATSYSIVKNHNGCILLDETSTKGSTFSIYLPASPGETSEPEIPENTAPVHGRGKILVMDDEEIIREMLERMLPLAGYTVTVSSDGAEAVELYDKALSSGTPFDSVILDLTVPGGMGGMETLEKLKKLDPKVKAIASSGYANDDIMANYREHGFRAVVSKPYNARQMEEVLYEVINDPD